jgi:hypothetical protein
MKARFLPLFTLVVTLTAILAPLAEATPKRP